jgi:hypothetical protein
MDTKHYIEIYLGHLLTEIKTTKRQYGGDRLLMQGAMSSGRFCESVFSGARELLYYRSPLNLQFEPIENVRENPKSRRRKKHKTHRMRSSPN